MRSSRNGEADRVQDLSQGKNDADLCAVLNGCFPGRSSSRTWLCGGVCQTRFIPRDCEFQLSPGLFKCRGVSWRGREQMDMEITIDRHPPAASNAGKTGLVRVLEKTTSTAVEHCNGSPAVRSSRINIGRLLPFSSCPVLTLTWPNGSPWTHEPGEEGSCRVCAAWGRT